MPVEALAGLMRVEKLADAGGGGEGEGFGATGTEGYDEEVAGGGDGDGGGGDEAGGGALDAVGGGEGEGAGGGVDGVFLEGEAVGVEAEEPLAVGRDGEGGDVFVDAGAGRWRGC